MATATTPQVSNLLSKLAGPTVRRLALSMGAAIIARLGLLLLAVGLGRTFGPSDYGTFTFATSMALLGAQVAGLGWPMLMNRLIPELRRDEEWGLLRGLRDAGDVIVLGSGLVAAAILAGCALISPDMAQAFLLSALLVIPFSTAIMRRQQLAAFRMPAIGLLFDQGFAALLAALVLFIVGIHSLTEAVLVFFGAMVAGNIITTITVRRQFPQAVTSAKRAVRLAPWMAMAWPLLVGMSSRLMMNKMDVLMLAPLGGLHESGLYGAAFRITFLLTFPQVVLTSVTTPMMSEAFAQGRTDRVRKLLSGSFAFAIVSAGPISLLLILFPDFILNLLFGAKFIDAGPALVWLTIGQLATSLAMPLQAALTMGGKEKNFGSLNFGGLALHVVLNFLLIPPYGAMGAAVSTALVCIAIAIGQLALNRSILVGR